MVQLPRESSVAKDAEELTEQIAGVVDVKLTGSPELAVAFKATGAVELMTCVGIAANEIACDAKFTVKLCVTLSAGA
jgi:hypothetical protein